MIMEQMLETYVEILHNILVVFVELGGTVLELFALFVMLKTGIQCLLKWLAGKKTSGLDLAEGIALALEFLLAAEVLHTVLATQVSDMIVLGLLVILRALMTFEIHLEMKSEKESHHRE